MTLLAMSLSSDASVSVEDVARELGALAVRVSGSRSVRLSGVHQDSRRVEPGDLFCARAGRSSSGADFVAQALERGAQALLVEQGTALASPGVPVLEVRDVRRSIGVAAEFVYGRPSRALELIGITGTNGKTTTSVLVEHALARLGKKTARLGTLGFAFDAEVDPETLTTPEADDVSRYLADVVRQGGTHFVMEVSSHALSLARVDALSFRVAAFTNLSQDHLDFYGSMAEYGAAKTRLFEALGPKAAVLNVDDAFGRALVARAKGQIVTTGRSRDARIRALDATVDAAGVRARVATPDGEVTLVSRLLGSHNLENLLLALGILCALGFEPQAAATALGSAPAAPGRLERCDEDADDVRVLVDYAHTPDALERVLAALSPATSGELICVFGCGGDRDPKKRPLMGAAVGRSAGRAILTSDNPRSENPAEIAAQVEAGLRPFSARYELELDRARAIEHAILSAQPGDTVLVAGKGHETYQIIGSERRPFDDRVEARRSLSLRRRERGA